MAENQDRLKRAEGEGKRNIRDNRPPELVGQLSRITVNEKEIKFKNDWAVK